MEHVHDNTEIDPDVLTLEFPSKQHENKEHEAYFVSLKIEGG